MRINLLEYRCAICLVVRYWHLYLVSVLQQDFVKITLDDDRLTAHSNKTLLLLKVKYLFYQMAISNKHVSKLI